MSNFNTGENSMSNIDNLTFGEIKQIAAMFNSAQSTQPAAKTTPPGDGRAVIVRSRDAGVLFGEFAGNDGSTIYLKNARQLWQWFAAKGITLIDVATHGVKADKCKFSTAHATVTIFNACALIDCTDEAAASIRKVG